MPDSVERALREFLDTIPAMPQVEYVADRYTWTAEQYLALIKLSNAYWSALEARSLNA